MRRIGKTKTVAPGGAEPANRAMPAWSDSVYKGGIVGAAARSRWRGVLLAAYADDDRRMVAAFPLIEVEPKAGNKGENLMYLSDANGAKRRLMEAYPAERPAPWTGAQR